MIKINPYYAVQVNKWSYDLVKITKDKDGSDKYTPIGYYHDLEGALQGYIFHKTKKKLSARDMSVQDALDEIKAIKKECKEEFAKAVDDNVE